MAGQFKFVVDLFGAAPQICGPAGAFTESDTVAFLFKFVDKNSGNVSYKWTVSERLSLLDALTLIGLYSHRSVIGLPGLYLN